MRLKFALPKGSLEKPTLDILTLSGYVIRGHERTYRPFINDPQIELKMLRPQEIPIAVAEGLQDLGITGSDWVKETGASVETLLNLGYGHVKLVAAVPKEWDKIHCLSDLIKAFHEEGRVLRICTEYLNLSSMRIMENPTYKELYGNEAPLTITPWWRKGSNAKVCLILSFGATEAKPPENADAIIDLTETGTTLEQNNLKAIEELYESTAVLIANKESLSDSMKRLKIYDILTLLKGTIDAKKKLHIFLNVQKTNLEALLANLPALKSPTISPLAGQDWFSVNTVIDREDFLRLLPILRRLAQGLVVHEPQQVLPLEEIARTEGTAGC